MDGLEHGSRRREDRHAPHVTPGCSATAIPTPPTEQQACRQPSNYRESGDFLKPPLRDFAWYQLLGQPYKLKGDPILKQGTDCILLTLRVLDAAGIKRPAAQRWWYRDLAQGVFWRVEKAFIDATEAVIAPDQWCVTIFLDEPHPGFGVVVDGGLVTATPKRGAHWRCLAHTPERSYRRVKA